ncbi:hypothetical protein [Shewanella sp. Arc9-LZ]|uniref:hypothetical protein n=1 Tax=Shewanella sp. Arc9-LZ TaxID=2698686 RepID=UPI00137C3E6D|nr:hypothetical protein [Shewanella sp. Arc9-LZ]QHS14671.1 hypothetical protein GUY17_16970 [Shewanella sp. Arc9-LZ]
MLEKKVELSPEDWLTWSDEEFNRWRREHDFPRIVNFLFETLPFFSMWLSEQAGLTRQDLIFHGPARFIRLYGEPMNFIEYDVSLRLHRTQPDQPILRHCFTNKIEKKTIRERVTRSVEFSSYIDWAYENRSWIFYKSPSSIEDYVRCLTPSGRSCETSTFINSNSSIQFNIPVFMPSVTIDEIFSATKQSAPPSLELLKLGGGGVTVVDGVVGEKNLEFTNVDNITLINPIITSFQDISYSTLRNLNIHGQIHAAKFHQCSIEIDVSKGNLSECEFEYCESTISLSDVKLSRSSIREKCLKLKLKNTEVSDCCFEYLDIYGGSAKEREKFNQSAKMTYSHLGYPDLAGKHFYLEQKEKRKGLRKSILDNRDGIGKRILSFFNFIWMAFQEVYWGYGERPFNIILFSLFAVISFSLFGYFNESSSTTMDLGGSLIFAFQAFTNITIKDVSQEYYVINLIGSFMSFFGVMSVGLLVASLSAKTKNYN